jgi:hypothetical protein
MYINRQCTCIYITAIIFSISNALCQPFWVYDFIWCLNEMICLLFPLDWCNIFLINAVRHPKMYGCVCISIYNVQDMVKPHLLISIVGCQYLKNTYLTSRIHSFCWPSRPWMTIVQPDMIQSQKHNTIIIFSWYFIIWKFYKWISNLNYFYRQCYKQ